MYLQVLTNRAKCPCASATKSWRQAYPPRSSLLSISGEQERHETTKRGWWTDTKAELEIATATASPQDNDEKLLVAKQYLNGTGERSLVRRCRHPEELGSTVDALHPTTRPV